MKEGKERERGCIDLFNWVSHNYGLLFSSLLFSFLLFFMKPGMRNRVKCHFSNVFRILSSVDGMSVRE